MIDSGGILSFGFRVSISGRQDDDPPTPAFVALKRGENGEIHASLVLTHSVTANWIVTGNTRVVDHGYNYRLRVHAKDWDGNLKFRNFASQDAGQLLLSADGRQGLAVGERAGCCYLDLKTWLIEPPKGGEDYVAAKVWNLALPIADDEDDWPLGR